MNDVTEHRIRVTVAQLLVVVVVMFAFVFVVMVPLYDVLCDAFGLNGKTDPEAYKYEATSVQVDTNRRVKVQFAAIIGKGMVWDFKPNTFMLEVHPGEATNTTFNVHNPTVARMVAQAIPSIVPSKAADYFHKTECFCFNQQPLEGGQSMDMPLQFIVDQDLPKDIHTITLSYTLFDVTGQAAPQPVAANVKNGS